MYTAIYNESELIATIYSKKDCPWCVKAKRLCKEKHQSYTEILIGEDISVENFKEKFPEVRGVPYILLNENVIGGYLELENYLNKANN